MALAAITAVVRPELISDKNAFLKDFVNQEFLGFMGVVVTITLASAGNLFIELNKLEDRAEASVFSKTKRSVKASAFSLIWSLVFALILVTVKPLLGPGQGTQAIANAAALTTILFSILVLVDLTVAAFNLDPRA
ncbi:MAG: hypothetical protein PSX79_03900 [bacterium]|nr:hypothetical protein [bacterium]